MGPHLKISFSPEDVQRGIPRNPSSQRSPRKILVTPEVRCRGRERVSWENAVCTAPGRGMGTRPWDLGSVQSVQEKWGERGAWSGEGFYI